MVTGGAGLIGRPLVQELERRGHDVIVFDKSLRPADDVRHLSALIQAMQGVDTVFHLAATYVTTTTFYTNPSEVLRTGLVGTANVVQAAVGHGAQVVFASSAEVYGEPVAMPTPETEPLWIENPLNPRLSYAASKIAGEMLVLHGGLRKAQVFRPHNVYGMRSKPGHVIPDWIAQVAAGKRIAIKGDPDATRSFCHVSDIVQGIVLMWEHGEPGIYHIGNDRETSMRELASMIDPDHSPVVDRSAGAVGSPTRRRPDLTKIRALGYRPIVKLEDGIAALLTLARSSRS